MPKSTFDPEKFKKRMKALIDQSAKNSPYGDMSKEQVLAELRRQREEDIELREYPMKCLPGDEPRILVTKEFVEKNRLSINYAKAREILGNPSEAFDFDKEVALEFFTTEQVAEYWVEGCPEHFKTGEIDHMMINRSRSSHWLE